MKLLDTLRHLRRLAARHAPLIEVGISVANLRHNLHTYQATYPHLAFAPVLKSNAYGHGLVEVARALDTEDIAFFMADSWHEASRLRHAGITHRILVVGYVRPAQVAHGGLRDVDTAIVDIEQLRELVALARRPVRIHLKLDTGMHRHGLLPAELAKAAELIKSNKHLHVVGICSHFADADTPSSNLTRSQLTVWEDALAQALTLFPTIEYRHIAATAAVGQVPRELANVARLGIGLYGLDRIEGSGLPLRPVLELRSCITSLRTVPAGDSVGYNATHVAAQESTIATVPIGYSEGVDRRLSGVGAMLVHSAAAPIAGRVSMNMTSLDVSSIPEARRGDTVVAISRNPEEPNSVEHIAKLIGTNYHEILIHIPAHLRRVVE